ncbi:MAG: alpha-galactosidase, partial [Acidobacteria bacterium]|nr:alpha-galactosidase [Acidobacteriota bacterium]
SEASGLEVAIHCSGEDRKDHHGLKLTGSMPGGRLVYAGMKEENGRLTIVQRDPVLNLRVESVYEFFDEIPVVRRSTLIVNEGASDVGIEYVSSAMLHNFANLGTQDNEKKLKIHFAHSSWKSEGQWRSLSPSRLGLVDNGQFNLSGIFFNNLSGWSSMRYLPMGMVENTEVGVTWFWQIEHDGSWHWELSDTQKKSSYVYIGGPDEEHGHAWKNLAPGASYRTVPVALGCVRGSFGEAVGALTRYRRKACLRPHKDNKSCPVIFNDYMNCLVGDPTEAKELPLIDAAAEGGCEYFVIDAGWYAELAETWWDSVGMWQPSKTRWPHGLAPVLGRIRDKGMIPGLWLEIEVAGINSPLRTRPDDWFFQRHGKRVIEHSRFLLDFRNPAVRAHADEVIDRLVREYRVGYIKMDYNINTLMGTEVAADSFGQGQLEHQRAYLKWIDSVYARHPDLVIENCGSGGGRMDYAMLSRLQLQSSSDQTDYRKYPSILVGALGGVLPEQLAVWSYPLADGDADEASFNMVNAMLCRVHQSGHLAKLNPRSLAQVRNGVRIYKEAIRPHLPVAVPSFPLGMPSIADRDSPIALIMRSPERTFLAVWRLNGGDTISVPCPHPTTGRLIYPTDRGIRTASSGRGVTLTFPRKYMAAILQL